MNRRVQQILQEIGVMTNKDEDFVLTNDSEIVILGCEANLKSSKSTWIVVEFIYI
jgi:hypothetical protein